MALLSVQKISKSGLAASFVAADVAGDTFGNDGQYYLHVKNGGGGAVTVTVASDENCNQGFDHDVVVSVPAAGERIIGLFELRRFGAVASVTYSGVTSVTVAAIRAGS